MASSLRMAAPKMANLAAQSSVKAARPQNLQKFTRAYSGKLATPPMAASTPAMADPLAQMMELTRLEQRPPASPASTP